MAAYRQAYQGKERAREWDLNDPNQLRNSTPVRGEDDAHLGPASLQVFQGEDPEAVDRKKMQHAQIQLWVQDVHSERVALREAELAKDRDDAETLVALDAAVKEMEAQKVVNKLVQNKVVAYHNESLVDAKRRTQDAQRQAQYEAEQRDLETHLSSSLLTEQCPAHAAGPHRKLADRFKGMQQHELQAIFDETARMQEAKQAVKQRELEENARMASEAEAFRKLTLLKEREAQRNKQALRKSVQAVVVQQDQEKKARYAKCYMLYVFFFV